MKKVYTRSQYSTGNMILKPSAPVIFRSALRALQLRILVAVILPLLIIFNVNHLQAQNCPTTGTDNISSNENTYYPGTGTSVAGATSIALGPIGSGTNFGSTPIAAGDIVLVIQMQGAQYTLPPTTTDMSYGSNSGNGLGMITTGLSAGLMEFAIATNAVPAAGGTLNISSGLVNSYSTSAYTGTSGQYTYQVIRVPQHFNLKLTATVTAPKWNGSTGGVTVLSAINQFNFNGQTVDASGSGFRGGGGRQLSGQTGLNKYDLYGLSSYTAHASKGEGIAGTPTYLYVGAANINTGSEGYPGGSLARGAPANGGGGAADSRPDFNDQNAGGGGGGNGGAGGKGGNGWQSFGVTGGLGGSKFQTVLPTVKYNSPSRLIMGGGGGAGTTNNGSGTPGNGVASGGSAGGGFVIINTTTITGTGIVKANGAVGNSTVTVDGSGGGGAGGSILIYAVSGHAGITAIANGADGSNNTPAPSATQHGPGGGGGGGIIYSNGTLNVASTVTGGAAGISSGSTATDSYGAAAGSVGVLTQTFPFAQLPPKMQICQSIVLPVTLLNFSASYESANNVKVSWSTTDEVNADFFVVERSTDAAGFSGVAQVDVNNSYDPVHAYSINDQLVNINSNIIYYRLRIVDKNGNFTYSKVVPVKLDQPKNTFSVYPNPVDNYAIMNIFSDKQASGIWRLIDNSGKPILSKSFTVSNGNNSVLVDQIGYLPRGIYIIQVMLNNTLYNQKLIKK